MAELDVACDKCGSAEDDEEMLLCDACDTGFHMFCLTPKVSEPKPTLQTTRHICHRR